MAGPSLGNERCVPGFGFLRDGRVAETTCRSREIGEQDSRVVVVLIEGHPGRALETPLLQLTEECRLSVAGRCDDRDDRRLCRQQLIDQGPARDEAGAAPRWPQLRLE